MDEKKNEPNLGPEQEQQPFSTPPVQPYRPPQMGTFRSPVSPPPPPGASEAAGPEVQPPEPPPPSFAPPQTPPYQPFEPPEVEEPHLGAPPSSKPPKPPRNRSILGPLMLILLGILFLLNNLGLVTWSVWEILWRFWPAWLIAIGIDMILGRRGRWGSLLAMAIVVTLIGGTFYAAGLLQIPPGGQLGRQELTSQPLGAAKEARVEINSSVSRLQIQGAELPGTLVQGSVQPLQGEELEQDYRVDGTTAYYTLSSRFQGPRGVNVRLRDEGRWNLDLNQAIPMALTLKTGVGQSDVDLSQMQVTDLRVTAGVGEVTLTLPATGELRGRIETGVGQTTLRIPSGRAARIRVQTGLGGVSSSGDLLRDGNTYTTPNWESATDRAEVEVKGGVGGIRLEALR